ncbi:hypothetical protein B566_EDAN013246 [Ephemera danica]|nr:hypothetical protein B566_EDAN013246 [Ephemera danica]
MDELGIPTLAQIQQQQQQCPVVQRTQDDAEDVLSSSSCSLPEASAGGDTSSLLQPSSPPLARPHSSLQLLPPAPPDASWSAPEDETTGGASTGDQSASEDSSLTDSERTLVGDQENLLAQLSTPCSDDSPQQGEAQQTTTSTPEDAPPDSTHTYKSFKESLDWEEDEEAGSSSSGAGHKRLISANFFRATPYEEDNTHMLKVELDKRTSLPALKKQLEPFVGVPMDYFKIFRSYSSSDEFEFTSYNATYRDGESLSIRLGRALRKGEFRGKVFQLSPGATESTKFLFDWILARGMLVADAKKQILDELKKKHSIDIPFDRCRLRKKSWKNPGQVYYDNQRFEDSMCIVANWELFVQELPEAPAPRPPNASLPELVLFVRRWSPSTLTLGPFQEVELASTAGEELRTKLAELSGIAAENIEIAKGQGSFPCDISVLSVNTDLEWNPPTNSLNSWPLNIFEDGHVILYRDSMESVKLLTAEERKEMERAENSRVSRLGGASISTYSPRKERALKIYLDATPPKSRPVILPFYKILWAHLSSVPGGSDVTQIWRVGTIVGCSGSLLIGVRIGEVVGQFAGPHEVVASLVWTISYLYQNNLLVYVFEAFMILPVSPLPQPWLLPRCKMQ